MVAQTDILLKRDGVSGSINVLVDTIVPKAIGLQLPILESGKLEAQYGLAICRVYHFRGEIENFVLVTDKRRITPKIAISPSILRSGIWQVEVASR